MKFGLGEGTKPEEFEQQVDDALEQVRRANA